MDFSEKHYFIIQSLPILGHLGLELKDTSRNYEFATYQLNSLPQKNFPGPEADSSTN
jgi:hypothetical protein